MHHLVQQGRLRWLWLLGAANGLVLALMLVGVTGWGGFVPTATVLAGLGAALGIYTAYRSRFACAHLLGSSLAGAAWLCGLVIGTWGVAELASAMPALLLWGAGACVATIALCLGWGALRTYRRLQANAEASLHQFVDLRGRALRPETLARPPGGDLWQGFGPAAAATANVPLLVEWAGGSRQDLAVPVAVLMSCAVIWLAAGQASAMLGRSTWLLQQQRRHGSTWSSPWPADLHRARVALPGSRWLCRPEDLRDPRGPSPPRGGHRRRSPRRRGQA